MNFIHLFGDVNYVHNGHSWKTKEQRPECLRLESWVWWGFWTPKFIQIHLVLVVLLANLETSQTNISSLCCFVDWKTDEFAAVKKGSSRTAWLAIHRFFHFFCNKRTLVEAKRLRALETRDLDFSSLLTVGWDGWVRNLTWDNSLFPPFWGLLARHKFSGLSMRR